MIMFKAFLKGYMQTMLFGIEERPSFKMHENFYVFLHVMNHFQFVAMAIQSNHNTTYQDFKLSYLQDFTQFFILNNTLKSSLSYSLAMVLIVVSFLIQVTLMLFIIFSTLVRIWTTNLIRKNSSTGNLNTGLQNWVLQFNETLHWYFVIYPVVYLQVAVISFSSLSCNSISLIPESECEITSGIQFLVIVPLVISFVHGQILIYIMRNHRFHETNSLKRRYSGLLLLNNTLILVEVFAHYVYQFENSDVIKYVCANIFAVNQIYDQLVNFPYRDPVRIPSIRLAFIYTWIVVAVTIYRFTGLILEENLFFFIVLPLGFWAVVGEGISQQFQHYAILNYNSDFQLEEKHIIIAVDQFYKYYLDFLKNAESQLKFFQFLMIHRIYCKNTKCYSKDKKYETLNMTSIIDLHTITLSVIKCIFKTAQNWLFSMQCNNNNQSHNTNEDLQFEQLQLQYISFISEIGMRPLIGYIELRKYQNNKLNNNSTYFVEITNKLSAQLEKQVIDNQQIKNQKDILLQDQRSQMIEITLQQQWYTQSLYENLLQKYLQLVNSKINHWQGLINGYPTLNPFQASTQQLCSQINELREMIDEHIGVPQEWFDLKTTTSKGLAVKKLTHAELNINVITLKLYSVFYSLLLNDFDRTNYIEQYVKDITSNDRQKEIDIIDNISLITDQTTIVLVSLVKYKGKIRNKNQLALANFFHYLDANDFKDSIQTVHQLLPKSMIQAHEMLIDQYIQTGHSQYFIRKINGYYQSKSGFIEKSYVKLGNLFEEKDDYVLTASILKCNMSNQLMVIDQEGKIIGVSEQLFKMLQQAIPGITVDFINDFCHAFLLFPQFSLLVKQNYSKIEETEHLLIQDEEHLFYLCDNLIQLNTDFVREQYEKMGIQLKQGLESINLSSWRSWKSANSSMDSKRSKGNKLFGHSLQLYEAANMEQQYNFLLNNRQALERYQILKTKIKISFQSMKVKSYSYPYFIIEMDHISQFDENHKFYNRYPSLAQAIEQSLQVLNFGSQAQKQETFQDSMGYDLEKQSGKCQSFQQPTHNSQKKPQLKSLPDSKVMEEQHKQMKEIIQQQDSQILFGIDQSNHALIKNEHIVDLNDISGIEKPYFDQPFQKNLDQDDEEFNMIDQHFDQLRASIDNADQRDQFKVKDDSQQEIEENLEKHSSVNKQGQEKNDLLEVLVQNRKNRQIGDHHDMEEEENNRKRSVASSSRTSTSKSPFLLVRSLYQLGTFQGTIRQVTAAMVLYLSLAFALVFIEINTIQSNYDILQTNINYVTLPETLNFYFLKMAMFSWLGLQSNLKVMTYSDFINKQMKEELEAMKSEIDVKLNDLYQGIIQYEKEILSSDLLLISINDMKEYRQELDLTQLIQQIQLHSFSYIDSQTDQSAISDAMFFRMNIPYIHRFALTFIALLNDNLIYYEDKIINDIVVLTAIFIPVFTVLLLYLAYLIVDITAYERQILMLITRVSQKQAEDIIIKLYEVRAVMVEPSQLEWKKINYFEVNYDTNIEQQNAMKAINTRSIVTASNSKQSSAQKSTFVKKSSRNYQNNSLAQRIYDLTLTNTRNYIIIAFIWIMIIAFIIGAILVTMGQVTDIKPTLNLNLQLVRFKLRFDSIVVQGEIIKTQNMIVTQLERNNSDYHLTLDTTEILNLFVGQYDGFQESMTDIYNSLAGNSGLLAAQKEELLNYFEKSLCVFMAEEIPFCQVNINSDEFSIPNSFIAEYGNPIPQDNNYEFVQGGIIGIVQEFTKTLNVYYNNEITAKSLGGDNFQTYTFLNSSAHINQFIEYFLDQGKLLGSIGVNLFEQNVAKLSQAKGIMSYYIYIGGFGVVLILMLTVVLWLKSITERQRLMRLSLTLIPYEVLLEPKTMSALKRL